MARIIYGVCGEGMGHAIRSKPIIEYLLKKHDVKVFASGRAYHYLAKHFGGVAEIDGIFLRYRGDSVDEISTFLFNASNIFKLLRALKKVRSIAAAFKPDIVFSDFEILTSYTALLEHIPLISISFFAHFNPAIARLWRFSLKSYIELFLVNKLVIPSADHYLVNSFFDPRIARKDATVTPPVLREAIYTAQCRNLDFILVYQTAPANKRLLALLKSIDAHFVVYGFNIDKQDGNLALRRFHESQFLKDLSSCSAIIANGGFSLLAEGVYLGKPILSIPINHQFEQIINAFYLEKFGYGRSIPAADRDKISEFIAHVKDGRYNSATDKRKKGNSVFFSQLDRIINTML